MRSCAASRPRGLVGASWLGLFAALLAGGDAAALELDELLRGMASAPGVHARFIETKEIALLSAPLESQGEIFFVPPRRFARLTSRPSATRFVVDGDRLLFRDAAGEQQLNAAGSRVARAVVENFIVLFNGDAEGLAARYDTEFSSTGTAWRLALRPKDRNVASLLSRVVLAGDGPVLLEMSLEEPNGDRTRTRYEDVRVAPLSEGELGRAFADEATP